MTTTNTRAGRVRTHLAALACAGMLAAAVTPSRAAAQACTAGSMTWIHQFGTTAADEAGGTTVDAAGNVYVAGNTGGALPGDISAGGIDAFVRKYDPTGNEAWSRQFGTAGDDRAWDVAVDAIGNVYVAASVASGLGRHAFLRKYDEEGTELWTREFGGVLADAMSVAVDASGAAFVTGTVLGAPFGQISAGSLDAFVRKYDSSGNHAWTRQFGTLGFDQARGVTLDTFGYVYVAGSVAGALPGESSAGATDIFVRKYDPTGTELWTDQFGSSGDDFTAAPAVDHAGNTFVTGGVAGALPGQTSMGGLYDVFLRKYDAAGSEEWTRQFGTPLGCPGCFGFDAAHGVAVDLVGNAFVAGTVGGPLPSQSYAFGGDAFVRMYDGAGNEVLTRQFGSPFSDTAHDLAVDGGSLYLAGTTFGILEGANPGLNWDAFAAKVFLRDVDPPSLSVTVSPNALWPPGHEMVEIHASVEVTDTCDQSPIVTLASVISNEPDDGIGDGDTSNDIEIVDPRTFLLRAERAASGTGRVYTVTYVATDASGNTSAPVSARVTVPLTRQ